MNTYLVEVFTNTDDLYHKGVVRAQTAKEAIDRVQRAIPPSSGPYLYYTACPTAEEVVLYDVLFYVDGKLFDRIQLKGVDKDAVRGEAVAYFADVHYGANGSVLEIVVQEHY